jgi:CII-binding regulator of phage lambda lysogenization HflD
MNIGQIILLIGSLCLGLGILLWLMKSKYEKQIRRLESVIEQKDKEIRELQKKRKEMKLRAESVHSKLNDIYSIVSHLDP